MHMSALLSWHKSHIRIRMEDHLKIRRRSTYDSVDQNKLIMLGISLLRCKNFLMNGDITDRIKTPL